MPNPVKRYFEITATTSDNNLSTTLCKLQVSPQSLSKMMTSLAVLIACVSMLCLKANALQFGQFFSKRISSNSNSNSEDNKPITPVTETTSATVLSTPVVLPLTETVDVTNQVTSLPRAYVDGVPTNGIIDYIGSTKHLVGDAISNSRWSTHHRAYKKATDKQHFLTRFNLWKQYPWKKIKGKVILKARIGGSIPLESSGGGFSFGQAKDLYIVDSLADITNMFEYATHDPRVQAVLIELDRLACGYGKLTEIRRAMDYFRQSGKEIITYCSSGSEKEVYLSLSSSKLYIPPDSGGLDIRGFSAAATFVRGVFDNLGIEPQVERIGKYKSFGDTFNRTSVSDAQREVISSLLTESSDFWVDSVASTLNVPASRIRSLWNETNMKSSYDYKELGLVHGVKYLDQVEASLKRQYRQAILEEAPESVGVTVMKLINRGNSEAANASIAMQKTLDDSFDADYNGDYQLEQEFVNHPRIRLHDQKQTTDSTANSTGESAVAKAKLLSKMKRMDCVKDNIVSLFPTGLYLRKMRLGSKVLTSTSVRETMRGPRIAVINAAGSINTGKSSSNGVNGKTLGSDTVIAMINRCKSDSNIKGVVLRIDSPGGSALASDLMWREIRTLSYLKPVVASMVDVAASGGYYMAMACNEIVAEETTITGSIGVVTSKFNTQELNSRLGYGVDNLSIGRYAEVLTSSRGFTQEEQQYFSDGAQIAYKSFVSKAAKSRDMSYEELNTIAQGRVWTGRQALNAKLVDHIGGFSKALEIVDAMASATASSTSSSDSGKESKKKSYIAIQTFKEPKSGLSLPFGSGARSKSISSSVPGEPLYLVDDSIASTNLVSHESLGISPLLKSLGLGTNAAYSVGNLLSSAPDGGGGIVSLISEVLNNVL